MEDAAHLSECFARVAAELSAILSHDAVVPNGTDPDRRGALEPADCGRAALEAYLHERRMSERRASSTTPRVPDQRAA